MAHDGLQLKTTKDTGEVIMKNMAQKSNVIPLNPDLHPDLDEASRFLKLLDPDVPWFAFQLYWDPKDGSKPGKRPKKQLVQGPLELVRSELTEWNKKRWGVAVTVNPTDGDGRTLENVIGVRAIKADFDDNSPPDEWPLEPSIIVRTTPGRFHFYWLVKGTRMTKEMGKAIEDHLVREYEADSKCAEMSRAMRLPGFHHMRNMPTMVKIIGGNGKEYRPSQLRMAFPPVKAEVRSTTAHPRDGEGVSRAIKYIPAEGYDTWINIGMALHDHFNGSDAGLAMWDEWSKTGSTYVDGVCEGKWRSFGRVSGIRIATLFYIARQHGYQPDGIEDLNTEFAMTPMGIIHHRDGEDKFMKMGDFKNWTANRTITGSDWLKSPNRRQYDRVVFCPGQVSTPRGSY